MPLVLLALSLMIAAFSQTGSVLLKKMVIQADDEIVIRTGDASITMKKNGSIVIKGSAIQIEGSGTVNVKASGEMILKGKKIGEN